MLLKNVLKTTTIHLKRLSQSGITTVQDLLGNFPRNIESTEITSNFLNIHLGFKNTISGKLFNFRIEKTPRGKKIGKATLLLDDSAEIEAVWFQIPYMLRKIKDGARVYLVGKISRDYGKIQISNPEVHLFKDIHIGRMRAVYTESPPITSKWLREKIAGCLAFAKNFPEILPDKILDEFKFPRKPEAIRMIHAPKSTEEWEYAKKRLSFEEIFEIQIRVMRQKLLRNQNSQNQFPAKLDPEVVKSDFATLPFTLTFAQKRVLFSILKDFEKDQPAHRLVQGDVGSGKTIVAFLAAAAQVRAGNQIVILAPTAILAQQHFTKAVEFFRGISGGETLRVELLVGATTAKNKKLIKRDLADGQIQILIGTHAVLTEDTVFKNLGLAIIDEQHRFGVAQRAILAKNNSHVVAMTATPIPRTLALTIYGNQDLSVIDELPPGRQKIITRIISNKKGETLLNLFIHDQIEKKRQVFWICPLVDESDKIEAKSVLKEYERISQEIFPDKKVEFLHGKLKSREKIDIMARFKNKEFDILVSTSVIEVGVDIPDATVMVIENAERFGLAQLHQFRGRIGRNSIQSYCFLMCGKPDDKNKTRLKALEQYDQGQKLAEIDLKLRGMGEIYGRRQSGMPDFKVADLSDLQMLQDTRDWALKILNEDVNLAKYPELKRKTESGNVYF